MRRRFLAASFAGVVAPGLSACFTSKPWDRAAYQKPAESKVAIVSAATYERDLTETILEGLRLFQLPVSGKTIVLKPNLVEYDPDGVINTHPAVVAGALEAFRRLGAARVVVAEGPGHHRDTEYLLTASRLQRVLHEHRAPYVDLNIDDARPVTLRSRFTNLKHLYLPETILGADLVV